MPAHSSPNPTSGNPIWYTERLKSSLHISIVARVSTAASRYPATFHAGENCPPAHARATSRPAAMPCATEVAMNR